MWDPTTWQVDDHEFRIYSDDYANDYAVVDQIDYQFFAQWRWKLKASRTWAGTKKPKVYLARSTHEQIGPDYVDEQGKRRQSRIVATLFLHTAIMLRTGIPKPVTNKKIICDHADGDEFNCKRSNLRWATIGFNNKNRFGSHENVMSL